jgi:subtilisin-like proprotein convertase family protein
VQFTAPAVAANTIVGFRLEVTDSRGARGEAPVAITVTPPEGGRIEVAATDVPLAIPDNNATGATSTITVTQDDEVAEMTVLVDIDHTWRGDLRVVLLGPGGFSKVLHDRTGGDADDLVQAFAVPEAAGRRSGGTWQLRVSDHAQVDVGTLRAWSVVFEHGAAPSNRAPSAAAGSDRTVTAGQTVALSAAGSSDPDGDPLTYQWTRTSGPVVAFAPSATARDASFVAPAVAAPAAIGVRLTVSDGRGGSASADVIVTVNPAGGGPLTFSATGLPRAIPDFNTTGITSSISVAEARTMSSLEVTVVIDHTWIGDLRVVLLGPGGFQAVLHDRTGNDADNINRTFSVPTAVGRSTSGTWQLKVSDHEAADAGTLRTFTIRFGT